MKKLFVFLIFLTPLVFSQPITLSKLLQSVADHYPLIQAAEEKNVIASAKKLSAQGAFDPVLSSHILSTPLGGYQNVQTVNRLSVPLHVGGADIFAGYRLGNGNFPIYRQGELTRTGGEPELGFSLPLLRDFHIDKRRTILKTAEVNRFIQEEKVRLIFQDTIAQAMQAYIDCVADKKRLLASQAMLSVAKVRQKALGRQHDLGDAAKVDVIENQQFIMQRKAALAMSEQALNQSLLHLSLFYRNDEGEPVVLSAKDLPSHWPLMRHRDKEKTMLLDIKDQMIDRYPEVTMLSFQQKVNDFERQLAHNQVMPDLRLEASLSQQLGVKGFSPLMSQTVGNVGLSLSVPLHMREAKGRYQVLNSQKKQLFQQHLYARQEVAVAVDQSLYDWGKSWSVYQSLKKEWGYAQAVERAEHKKFKAGDSSLFLVNQREKTTLIAQLSTIEAAQNYQKIVLALNRLSAFVRKASPPKPPYLGIFLNANQND